ncbi:olfactory receptor 4P4-like [Rattus rattus]|uniref:olfactory receptor 4P4-like n=1 Tax=Rattus rattus TaxID=10117 RepID=UPI0013F37879|nr:olfactory receptor 4P4-like [Rattus rattus]
MDYRTNITEFLLLGFSQTKEIQIICFVLFLLCYIAILFGNLLIIISVTCSHLLNQPMYFFLSYLALSDLCYTSTVTPNLIINLVATRKSISYNGCMTQLFTMHFFGGIEVFILTGMAYDRYVAICKPLHYTIIMNRQKCDAVIVASCAGGFLHSFGQFLLAVFLPYCGPNEIDHYFCDVYPLLKLACTDTRKIGFLVIANSGLMGLVTFLVLLISYAVILYTVRSYSTENRRKALSTCSSHVTVVVLFFAPLLFIYIRPATTLPEDKVFALFYTIIAPMLNPLIYTLRNKEMKNATKRLCYRITGSEGSRVNGFTVFHHHTVS